MARLWKKPGIPHGGWEFVRTVEHDYPTAICEMCDQKNIKYIDIVAHPEYEEELKVGQDCSGWMTALPNGTMRYPDATDVIFLFPNKGYWRVMAKNHKCPQKFQSRGEAGIWALDNIILKK
jgi:hypothetical protein